VFPSLCDWLDAEVPIEWLADFLNLINKTPNLDWLLLTKRPENWKPQLARALTCCMTHGVVTDGRFAAAKMVEAWLNGTPPANVWIGTSIEDQKRADERIPELLKIPARVRFLSVEPLLGPVELTGLRCGSCGYSKADMQRHMDHHICKNPTQLIAWTIIGGESGPKARPCNIEWIRSIVEQCKSAAVPCFVKQLGSQVVSHGITGPGQHWPQGSIKTEVEVKVEPMKGEVVWLHGLKHSKGGDQIEWPKDLRVRQFPEVTS
jgi:protein gp37